MRGSNHVDKQSPELTVRYGTPDDYEAALEIQRRAYFAKEAPLYGPNLPPMAETPGTLAAEIAGGKILLVGEMDGRVVASLRMKKLEDGAVYFGRLSVDPDMQGNGIGKKMALAVESFNPDAPAFVLDCGDRSDENMYIYSKLGYVKTGKTFQVENGPFCHEMRKERM